MLDVLVIFEFEFQEVIRIALKVESETFLTEVRDFARLRLRDVLVASHINAPLNWASCREALDAADPDGDVGALLAWGSSDLRELLLHFLNFLVQDLDGDLAFFGRLHELVLDVEVVLNELLQLDKAVAVNVTFAENLVDNLVSVVGVNVLFGQKSYHLLAFDAAVTVNVYRLKVLNEAVVFRVRAVPILQRATVAKLRLV